MAPCGVLLMHLFFNFILFFKSESWGYSDIGLRHLSLPLLSPHFRQFILEVIKSISYLATQISKLNARFFTIVQI